MGDHNEVQLAAATTAQVRLTLWQRLKNLGIKKLILICLGIGTGLGIGVVATVACIMWLSSREIPARDWSELDIASIGVKAKLKTDWNDSVRYQLVVTPRSDDLKAAFDHAVQSQRDSISLTIHLYDKAGFELCKKEHVKPTPVVNAENRIEELHSNDVFYSFECSRSDYKKIDHWSLGHVFPQLSANNSSGSTNAKAKPAATSASTARQPDVPTETDDTLTGFDFLNGHLETLSGNTFLVRTGEQDIANTWNIRVQVEGGKQPRLHITCKTKDECVIENTTNNQAVHGRRIR